MSRQLICAFMVAAAVVAVGKAKPPSKSTGASVADSKKTTSGSMKAIYTPLRGIGQQKGG